MIKGYVCFDRFRNDEEVKKLQEAANKDNHGLFCPTHPLRKDGEFVGYFSVGAMAAVNVFAWLSTEFIASRESFMLINSVEDMVARGGAKAICFPVPKDSPFHPLMESMGYKNAGNYDYFVKEL